jgi:hypothetical protein
MNCAQNVVYVMMLLHFLELCMFYIAFAAHTVSPVESWKGLFYNMWFGALVLGIMCAFKDTLETLILFENAKRARDSRKDITTVIAVNKDGAQIKNVDYSSNTPAWPGVACFLAHKFSAKAEQKEDEPEPIKEATSPSSATTAPEDEIKPDAASASSSTRSNADTSDMIN